MTTRASNDAKLTYSSTNVLNNNAAMTSVSTGVTTVFKHPWESRRSTALVMDYTTARPAADAVGADTSSGTVKRLSNDTPLITQ